MTELTQREIRILNALAETFYKIVPVDLKTYCSVTSRIAKTVLRHFGIEAELLPCQVWLVTPEENFIVGFTGQPAAPGKWNGHVVCSARNFIIDTALHHFTREFSLNVPYVATTPCFALPTQVIARLDLTEKNCLWWHCAPSVPDVDTTVPDEPPELIAKHSARLIEHMSTMPEVIVENLPLDSTQESTGFSLRKM